jgi:hypothetical protein
MNSIRKGLLKMYSSIGYDETRGTEYSVDSEGASRWAVRAILLLNTMQTPLMFIWLSAGESGFRKALRKATESESRGN